MSHTNWGVAVSRSCSSCRLRKTLHDVEKHNSARVYRDPAAPDERLVEQDMKATISDGPSNQHRDRTNVYQWHPNRSEVIPALFRESKVPSNNSPSVQSSEPTPSPGPFERSECLGQDVLPIPRLPSLWKSRVHPRPWLRGSSIACRLPRAREPQPRPLHGNRGVHLERCLSLRSKDRSTGRGFP